MCAVRWERLKLAELGDGCANLRKWTRTEDPQCLVNLSFHTGPPRGGFLCTSLGHLVLLIFLWVRCYHPSYFTGNEVENQKHAQLRRWPADISSFNASHCTGSVFLNNPAECVACRVTSFSWCLNIYDECNIPGCLILKPSYAWE